MPMRYSIVGSTLAIPTSAFIIATIKSNNNYSISPSQCQCQCEAGEGNNDNVVQEHHLQLTSNYHHDDDVHQYQYLSSSTMILASSPSSSSLQLGNINDDEVQQSTIKPIPRKWWKLQWWGILPRASSRQRRGDNKLSWWGRIGQTVFVITRSIEIVARLSPLLLLTPTAMVVSYYYCIDPIYWKRYVYSSIKKKEDDLKPLLTIEGLDNSGDDNMFTTQFQEEPKSIEHHQHHHHHHQSTTWASDLSWRYTLHTLQCLGPAFVKLGQWAATRRDLFPVHMCNHLSELHDTARIHDIKYTHQALVSAFGEDYESRGLVLTSGRREGIMDNNGNREQYEDGILGSGSAAQVHRGTLTIPVKTSHGRNNNDQILRTKNVAIKVLHPNTRQLVERDLALMQYIADFIDKAIPLEVVKMLSLPRAVSTFAYVMERQVDLRIEGRNLEVFRDNFGLSKYDDEDDANKRTPPVITFPKPEPGWVSEKVLVEEHAGDDAVPISRYLGDNSPEGLKARKKLAGPLLRAFLKMVFSDNFIHADLHPG